MLELNVGHLKNFCINFVESYANNESHNNSFP